MSRLPLIGIEVDLEANAAGRRYSKCYEAYFDAVVDAGGAPLLLCPTSEAASARVLETLDGVIVPGGDDFAAEEWGAVQRPCERYAATDSRRLLSGKRLMTQVLDAGLPYLGICYGAQLLNVVLGGSLVQDIPDEVGEGALDHRAPHGIVVEAGTLLARLVGGLSARTNSRHHQSVLEPGRGLRVSARASDGVVEAIEGADPSRYLLGVQWHAEELGNGPAGAPLFRALVAAAAEQALVRRLARSS
jgi:putative glutamine amidotransferase